MTTNPIFTILYDESRPSDDFHKCAVVAQLDRALDSDSKGQRFESPRPHQKRSLYCSTATFLFCHGLVLVNPFFDYVRGNIGHDRHEKTDKIAHGISFPCWFCTLGSTRAILSVFVFIKGFGRQPWAQKAHRGACCQQRITRRPLPEPRRKGCHSASKGFIRDYSSVRSAISICFRS